MLTTDAQAALNAKPKEQKAKENLFRLDEALGGLANQVLASSRSMEELRTNGLQALGTLLNQSAQAFLPGIGGQLLGGALNFGINLLGFNEDSELIEDNALRMLMVNTKELANDYAAVRDRQDINFSGRWRRAWTSQGLGLQGAG